MVGVVPRHDVREYHERPVITVAFTKNAALKLQTRNVVPGAPVLDSYYKGQCSEEDLSNRRRQRQQNAREPSAVSGEPVDDDVNKFTIGQLGRSVAFVKTADDFRPQLPVPPPSSLPLTEGQVLPPPARLLGAQRYCAKEIVRGPRLPPFQICSGSSTDASSLQVLPPLRSLFQVPFAIPLLK
ncbi:hypothetical protein GYMLUDRAFT_251895 [Collybiopsis luxurians FD-317 M1]|uniref:Uncharacterized protein n=1 Tax=Collybiopsis luxurians FD-317 M1 TaxID=944289 RepID=A0A0D0C9X3_9AGAR|nr:hypothetical protein GYMLUDRAFT_251895 [Collybiopsis luxurians FD-317 M1]